MIFVVPISLILMVLLCAVAIGYGIIQNIGVIIVAIIIIAVFIYCFINWPGLTFASFCIIAVVALCYNGIEHQQKIDNAVTISIAIDECRFFNEEGEQLTIPKGAIVAKYTDPDQVSVEKNTDLNSQICSWYIDGEIHYSTISFRHDMTMADGTNHYGVANNIWNLQEVDHISIADFKSKEWWIQDE